MALESSYGTILAMLTTMRELFLKLIENPNLAREIFVPCSLLGALCIEDDASHAELSSAPLKTTLLVNS
jgi:hypothetical protein